MEVATRPSTTVILESRKASHLGILQNKKNRFFGLENFEKLDRV